MRTDVWLGRFKSLPARKLSLRELIAMVLLQYKRISRLVLLSAMQAITIHLIIRLEEGEREYNNANCLLVSAVAVRFIGSFVERIPCWYSTGNCTKVEHDWLANERGRYIFQFRQPYDVATRVVGRIPAKVSRGFIAFLGGSTILTGARKMRHISHNEHARVLRTSIDVQSASQSCHSASTGQETAGGSKRWLHVASRDRK